MSFRVPQPFLRSVTLRAQFFFTQYPANDCWKMTNIVHLNAVGSAFSNQFRHSFALYFSGQEYDGCMPAILLKEFYRLTFPVFANRKFSQNQVAAFCTSPLCEVLRSYDVCSDSKLGIIQFSQGPLDICCGSMNNTNTQELGSEAHRFPVRKPSSALRGYGLGDVTHL
jgi:hypothetical protein